MRLAAHHIAPFAAILFLSSCKPMQQVSSTSNKDSVRVKIEYQVIEKVRDTTLIVPADSALIEALVECDSLRRVQIKSISKILPGKNVKPSLKLEGNRLTARCKVDSLLVYLQWKDRYERLDSTLFQKSDSTTVIVQPVNYVTGFQWFQIWTGRSLLLLLLLYGGWKLLRSRFSILKKIFK